MKTKDMVPNRFEKKFVGLLFIKSITSGIVTILMWLRKEHRVFIGMCYVFTYSYLQKGLLKYMLLFKRWGRDLVYYTSRGDSY